MVFAVITEVIGDGETYPTITLWEAAADKNLVSADEQWDGKCKDEVFAEQVTISGATADATRFIRLTTDTNASFADDDTNELDYREANGAAVSAAAQYGFVIDIATPFTVVEKLQIRATHNDGSGAKLNEASLTLRGNIITCNGVGGNTRCIANDDSSAATVTVNNLCIYTAATTSSAKIVHFSVTGDSIWINNTFVIPSSASPHSSAKGINENYANASWVNNCVFGAPSGSAWVTDGSFIGSPLSNNASDDTTSPGTAAEDSLTYADQFIDVSGGLGALDFRLKAGNGLHEDGIRDATHTNDLDIFGNPRSLTTPSIGCFETQAAVAANIPSLVMPPYIPAAG